MRTLAVVLVLALASSFGEALRCNWRYSIMGGGFNTVVTCKGPNEVCAEVLLKPPTHLNHFRNCMDRNHCKMLQLKPKLWTVRCCGTDLCN